jgi:Fe-S cluster assembly protein SufD
MENLITSELIKNSKLMIKRAYENKICPFSASYKELKMKALTSFETQGLPSKSDEDWKYTSIAKNLSPHFYEQKESLIQESAHDVPKEVIDTRGMMIFNNGIFNKFLSVLPEGIEMDSLEIKDSFYDSFDSLNFGVALSPQTFKIKKNTVIDFPISIIHLVDEAAVNKIVSPRVTINASEFSRVSFCEIFVSTEANILQYTTNAVTHFNLSNSASIEHVVIQMEAKNAVHIGLIEAEVNENATFTSMILDFGLLTARHNLLVNLREKGAQTSAHGLFSLKLKEHTDIFSTIIHHAPHTTSEQLFKGLLSGDSHGIFTGKIIVKKDAQKSSSSQLNKNLLLSKKAHIDTRPQLLVHADDVKCSHGATIGQLSKDEEFYLESRGISIAKARLMLCLGFATDVVNLIMNPAIKKRANEWLTLNLEHLTISEATR